MIPGFQDGPKCLACPRTAPVRYAPAGLSRALGRLRQGSWLDASLPCKIKSELNLDVKVLLFSDAG
jgi:hypothetical protein